MKKSRLLGVVCACVFSLLQSINSQVHAAPIIDISVTANGDTTYTYDIAVTNNNSGELYFFGVDIDHINYDLNGWGSGWMDGTWSNAAFGGDSDPFSTAWINGSIATGDTLSGFSFTSYDYVTDLRVFAWNNYMTGPEDANLLASTVNYGWEYRLNASAAVPVPAAVWLFGSGLLVLIGIARRKKLDSSQA